MNPRWTGRLIRLSMYLVLALNGCDCDDDDDFLDDDVIVRVQPGVDFGDYATFRILDNLDEADLVDADVDPDKIPDDVKLNIDVANDQARIELERIGLTEVDEGEEADLSVATLATTKEEDGYYWSCVPGYWWGYWGWYWDPCAWLEPIYVNYSTGTMLLGLADPKLKEIVFGGLLQGVLTGGGDAEERIRAGVHQMFLEYPERPNDRDN